MRLLMVTAELAPIAKVGGLADAVAALAKTLSRLGHEVVIALPRYRAIDESGLMLARRLTPLKLPHGEATLFDARISPAVELVLIDVPGVYNRDGIYGDGGQDHADNLRRFSLFCQAVAALAHKRAEADGVDVVHAHDWPAALVPLLLRGAGIHTVLTVHNAAHQGRFPREQAADLDLPAEIAGPDGEVNLLAAGIRAADAVTTVSPSYAREIQTPDYGCGLERAFAARAAEGKLTGILNGIDYAVWSPATDPHLPARYDAEDPAQKARCKASLLNDLGLSLDPDRPLLVSVGRVCAQKGSDRLAEAIGRLAKSGAQLLIAGDGDAELTGSLQAAVDRCSDGARYLGGVSEAMTHRLIAAADLVLMPSRFEPCGLVQQYAQRYGAAPVVRATGGLCDTVVDCDCALDTGTGFSFDEPSAEALIGATARALSAMRTPRWADLRRRMMRLERSWERPARQYLRLYQG